MDRPMNDLGFRFMSYGLRLRDFFQPPIARLNELGIMPNFIILDYGCGPGSFSVAAAEIVGEHGMVYALDNHPLAVQQTQKVAAKKGLTNVETTRSDGATGLPDEHVDVVLMSNVLHHLSRPHDVLEELHRVLKASGTLAIADLVMRKGRIVSTVTSGGLFSLGSKGKWAYSFLKA